VRVCGWGLCPSVGNRLWVVNLLGQCSVGGTNIERSRYFDSRKISCNAKTRKSEFELRSFGL
jgi:hypothetical protein